MGMMAILLLLMVPGQDPGPGKRIDLDGATLFVPDGFRDDGRPIDVVLHLHGAASVIEPAFVKAGWPGVLIAFNRNGLSSVYATPFRDPTLFPDLLDRAMKALQVNAFAKDPALGRVVVSSFSAGFGGVRELLKVPGHADRIDAVVLADSLYCGYEEGTKQVDANLIGPFRSYAARAADGSKVLLLTHSAQVPDGYASTTETADYLIDSTGARKAEPPAWGPEWPPTRSFVRGKFAVLGFPGVGPEDHMRHLRRIDRTWTEARALIGK